jgi:Ca-activated chloride channel homolog
MSMRARSSLLLGAWLLAACSSSTAYQQPPHPPQPIDQATQATELPAHHFYARERSGSVYPVIERVAFTTLPAMVQSRKCVDAGAIAEGRPGSSAGGSKAKPKKVKKTGGTAPGHVPYKDTTTAAAATPTTPADGTRVSAKSEEKRRDVTEPAAEPTQAAPESEASADFDDGGDGFSPSGGASKAKRDARRSRREAKRAYDEALATSSAEPPMGTAEQPAAIAIEPLVWPPAEEGWGAATFLSNDDTMSLSSAQRVLFAIDQHLPLPPQHVRPHELLNYFSFATSPVPEGHDFSVHAEIAPSRRQPGLQTLGLSIAGRPVGREGRRNAVLTLVVDRSGSMKAEGRMEYLKRGLLRMVRELKDGDVVHVIAFDQRVCNPLRNFVVGRDDIAVLTKTIHAIEPAGSTNLHAGLELGYQLADASYQPTHTNRVVLVTDALANTGVTDAHTMAMVSDWYDARRIRLSGVGVGREFDDALLDRLTEKGRGAYVFLGSEAEVDAVFGDRFSSLVETIANDVHFRLHLPPSLRIEAFHGEEASTSKQEVQAVHFFADTSQLLLADLEPWQGTLRPQDEIMLEIEYQHPDSGQIRIEDHVRGLGQIGGQIGGQLGAQREDRAEGSEAAANVRKAEVIMHFIEAIERQAHRGAPQGWRARPGAWQDAAALEDCSQTRAELQELAAGSRDAEVARVLTLWDGYCARFEGSAAGRPGRKGDGGWPGAQR